MAADNGVGVRSPILQFESAIAGVAYAIAPERGAELRSLISEHRFELKFVDERAFGFRVNAQSGVATLPVAALEYLWCCAYAFFVIYQDYTDAQLRRELHFNFDRQVDSRRAVDLLNWACRNMIYSGVELWPIDLPRPAAEPEYASYLHVANELFLGAVGWILQHEIAHVVRGDKINHGIYSIQCENAADADATEWILGSAQLPMERQKRLLCICVAILALQMLEMPGPDIDRNRTHPRPLDRLERCLEQSRALDDDATVSFAAVALQFQLNCHGIMAQLDGESARDILGTFMIAFLRQKP